MVLSIEKGKEKNMIKMKKDAYPFFLLPLSLSLELLHLIPVSVKARRVVFATPSPPTPHTTHPFRTM